MDSGIRDFGLTFIARIVTIVMTLLSQSVLAWGLGVEGRGAYAICVLIPTMLMIVFSLGCDVAVQFDVASKRQTLSEGVIHITIYGLVTSLIAALVGLVCLHLQLPIFTRVSHREIVLALATIPLSFLGEVMLSLLTSIQEFFYFAVFSVLGGVLQAVLAIVFVLVLEWQVIGAIVSLILSNLLLIVGVLVIMRHRFGLRMVRPSFNKMLDMLHYGLRYYLGKISNTANVELGTILMALVSNKAEIGIFAVASQLSTRVLIVPDTLATVLIPRVASENGGNPDLIARAARISFILCGVLLGGLAVFAKPIVSALFSSQFLDSIPLIHILVVGVLLRGASKSFVPYLLGTNRPGISSWAVGLGVFTNIILVWLLIPRMGPSGAAVAMVASYALSAMILTVAFRRLSGLSVSEICRLRGSDWAPLLTLIRQTRGCEYVRMSK